ncbi:hypothetical protein OIU77_020516 [Salix suchowensis]|uniref:Protein LURP-one-related 15-like n=1 Tax=Salix suchowensis TaxID=1278906 RepID=A0ABQ9C6P3_9ROSI|nr:hypothetical protein OIU77_020516 [Salix suchowensis]
MATGQASSNPVPAMRTHPPVEHAVVVVGPQYLAQYPVELAVSTKLLTLGENDFKVADINGTVIFHVKSKLLTLHDRRFMKDASDIFLPNSKGGGPDFKVKGGYGENSCSILLGNSNTMLAQMHRKHSLKSKVLETDNFGVTVYPNVDYAFIIALVVILDEINADRSGED